MLKSLGESFYSTGIQSMPVHKLYLNYGRYLLLELCHNVFRNFYYIMLLTLFFKKKPMECTEFPIFKRLNPRSENV